jgi:hypothetical protein
LKNAEKKVYMLTQALGLRVEGGSEDSASQSSHEDKRSGNLGEHD